METKSIYDWVALGLPIVSSVLVIVVSAKMDRKKASEEFERQQALKLAAEREAKLDATLEELRGEIRSVKAELESLRHTVTDMKRYDQQVRHDLLVLTKHHERDWEYVAALGELVSELASGMRDKHLDGNITAAIAHFHSFEKKLMTDLANEHELAVMAEKELAV